MKKHVLIGMMLLLAAAIACAQEDKQEDKQISIGARAPEFTLTNAADGKTVAFQADDGKTKVVIFTCNHCPYAKAFEQRIIDVAKEFQQKGVVFYAVNPNDDEKYPDETMANMKARAIEKGYPFPYLKDGDSKIARAYGARVTPHVFVVNGNGTVVYRGYVDDDAKPEKRKTTGLTDALNLIVDGREIIVTDTRAFGCTIKWKT